MSSTNHELQLAGEFVRHTGCHIFLTGKAGTGKTTFLRNLHKNTAKRMIITAPTGVAAINAGGVTLHSFFQLPFGPFVPGSETYERHNRRQFRFSKEKKRIIKSLDLLVIDEISMVRADLLDAVDAVLRRHRLNNQPFGGVQLLMIGDLHQLSPVARRDEWQLLQQHYESVYFFSSHALDRTQLVTIELKHIYRQSDVRFIELLNRVRNNRLNKSTLAELNRRYSPGFVPDKDQGYITLTTHNSSAASINQARLQSLAGEKFRFQAEISGDFPEAIYPTPATLVLKKGAQVMFMRNDPSADKRYYNGKIGKISRISDKKISVSCPGEPREIDVEPVSWKNIKYTFNKEKGEIEEAAIGEFAQYPLKPAWAITIHKSQGLTFEKAVIDAEGAFTHGQVYVALSRCKTLEGLVLRSPLSSRGIEPDKAVTAFDEDIRRNQPSASQLLAAKIRYQQQLLLACFDFQRLQNRFNYLVRLLLGNSGVVQLAGVTDLRRLEQMATEEIFSVSKKFRRQLRTLFDSGGLPESNAYILERISKASGWFQEKFDDVFEKPLEKLNVETDNTELRKKIGNALDNLHTEISVKLAGVRSCAGGFSPSSYLRAVSAAEIDCLSRKGKKPPPPTYSESDIAHPELLQKLKDWRAHKAEEKAVPHFQILHQRVLIQIAACLPHTTSELMEIRGVGKKTVEKFGQELVALVSSYLRKQAKGQAASLEPGKPETSAGQVKTA